MKKISKKLLIISILFFSVFSVTFAQSPSPAAPAEYKFLAPLEDAGIPKTTDLASYVPAVVKLIIGIAAVLAFVMITYGGILYSTSDAISGKSQGREYITNALYGLLLVLASYLILWTINPKTLEFDLGIPVPNITASSTASGGGGLAGCPNCVSLVSLNLPTKGPATGRSIDAVFGAKLQSLNESLNVSGGWYVYEAYPPSSGHDSACHSNGTCIDAGLNNRTAANINEFYTKARAVGLSPKWEVHTQTEKDAWISQGVPPERISVNTSTNFTGQHFHMF